MLYLFLGPAFRLVALTSFRFGFTTCAVVLVLATACATLAPFGAASDWVAWAGCALGAYLLAAMHIFISIGIRRTVKLANRMAAGELVASNISLEGVGGADAEQMWNALLHMSESLTQIVQQVRSSSEAIAGGSRSIAEGNADLAQRTHEQAAALEETAAATDQLAAGARQNADSCKQALDVARRAGASAGTARDRMTDVTATMAHIDQSAQQVASILSTVEGLAFQTNILALNAAVEAARAGEQGRGFAVVATEVRTLAQRSATAAREIKALIDQSVGSAERGRKVVDEAGASFRQVISEVQEVSACIESIARTSREQSTGIEDVRRAMLQIDDTTQQNAALVEEATSAAEAFEQETTQLLKVVRRFKADRGGDRARIVKLVKQAVRHVKQVGLERGCADLGDPRGEFVRGEDYVFVFDVHGKRLAMATDPATVGRNDIDMQDADGTFYVREIIQAANGPGGFGWCEYRFHNPRTGRVEPKSVYVERLGDVVLGCGIYQGDEPAAAALPVRGGRPAMLAAARA